MVGGWLRGGCGVVSGWLVMGELMGDGLKVRVRRFNLSGLTC